MATSYALRWGYQRVSNRGRPAGGASCSLEAIPRFGSRAHPMATSPAVIRGSVASKGRVDSFPHRWPMIPVLNHSSGGCSPSFRRASPVRTLRPDAGPHTLRVRDELGIYALNKDDEDTRMSPSNIPKGVAVFKSASMLGVLLTALIMAVSISESLAQGVCCLTVAAVRSMLRKLSENTTHRKQCGSRADANHLEGLL